MGDRAERPLPGFVDPGDVDYYRRLCESTATAYGCIDAGYKLGFITRQEGRALVRPLLRDHFQQTARFICRQLVRKALEAMIAANPLPPWSKPMEFEVSVLSFEQAPEGDQLAFLKENATYVRKRDVWLFEGDVELFLSDELAGAEVLGEVTVPNLGGLNDHELAALIAHVPDA